MKTPTIASRSDFRQDRCAPPAEPPSGSELARSATAISTTGGSEKHTAKVRTVTLMEGLLNEIQQGGDDCDDFGSAGHYGRMGSRSLARFKGYEDWQAVRPRSLTDPQNVMRLIVANRVMPVDAYKEGVSGNGKPFPEAPAYRED